MGSNLWALERQSDPGTGPFKTFVVSYQTTLSHFVNG